MRAYLRQIIADGIRYFEESIELQKAREEEIKERWHESKKLPRKLKKKVRKDILLDWSINQHWKKTIKDMNPFIYD